MEYIGPIVRNEVFFFTVILGAAAILVLREWMAARAAAPANISDAAERRRMEWERRKQRRWAFASAFTCTAVILILAAEFAYTRVTAATIEAHPVQADGSVVRVPISDVSDSNLHVFSVDASGTSLRFIVVRKPNGSWGTALDACMICGMAGYTQDGSNVVCRNCASAIYVPTIGQAGGCNPIAVPSRAENGSLVIDISSLAEARSKISK